MVGSRFHRDEIFKNICIRVAIAYTHALDLEIHEQSQEMFCEYVEMLRGVKNIAWIEIRAYP